MSRRILACWLTVAIFTGLYAQEVEVKGSFISDSVRIGDPVPFALSVRYPVGMNILLPDSTATFGKFEYRYRKWFPTRTSNGISTDSAIYWVATFELDSLQMLSLEALELTENDTVRYRSDEDAILLSEVTGTIPPTVPPKDLPVKSNTAYWNVRTLFNYPLWSLAGGLLIIALMVVWIMFGAAIRRYFKRRRLSAGFARFTEHFTGLVEELKQRTEPEKAEALLRLWKEYMEQLEERPYRKLTSREIQALEQHERVKTSLSVADRLIYGGIRPSNCDAFYDLRSFSEDRFHQRLEALRHPQSGNA